MDFLIYWIKTELNRKKFDSIIKSINDNLVEKQYEVEIINVLDQKYKTYL